METLKIEILAKALWGAETYAVPDWKNINRNWSYLRSDSQELWKSIARRFIKLVPFAFDAACITAGKEIPGYHCSRCTAFIPDGWARENDDDSLCPVCGMNKEGVHG